MNFITLLPGLLRALGGILKALFIYKAGRDLIIKNQEKLAKEAAERLAEVMKDDKDFADRTNADDLERVRNFLNLRRTR